MFSLKDVVPWGRSFDEYRRMFALTDGDLHRQILGCADGPASFSAELTASGGHVVSCDPLYRLSAEAIRQRIDESFPTVVEQTRKNAAEFVWDDKTPSIEALAQLRMTAMRRFLDDYDAGKAAGRYIEAELPNLPFENDAFDLALCSHFLFLYSGQFSEAFHVGAILELCRVSREVRIFPLLELGSVPSRHLQGVIARLRNDSFEARVEAVDYEFQRGGNQMLRIRRLHKEEPLPDDRSNSRNPGL